MPILKKKEAPKVAAVPKNTCKCGHVLVDHTQSILSSGNGNYTVLQKQDTGCTEYRAQE